MRAALDRKATTAKGFSYCLCLESNDLGARREFGYPSASIGNPKKRSVSSIRCFGAYDD
jgi:hypothetical protein